MTVPIPTRFSDDEVVTIDRLVEAGLGRNRSEVVRTAVARLADELRRVEQGRAIATAYRSQPQSTHEDAAARAAAAALTAAEPW
jgi:Arc/MetJ-type ribon-helix-helix transcriptional regulator